MTFFRSQLKWKFFSYFVGIVVFVVGLVSGFVYYFQTQMLFEQAQEKAFRLTSSLAYASTTAILLDDYITVQALIDGISGAPDIRSIAILDTLGTVIAANKPEMRGFQFTDPLTARALKEDTFIQLKEISESGEELWDTAVPIWDFNQRVGTARIKYSVEDVFAGLQESILGVGIFAILVSLVLAYRFSQSISQPIREVVQLADEYGKGNLDASLTLSRNDEIGHLVIALNKLSENLKSLIDEKIANEGLIIIGEFSSYIIHDLKNPISGIHLLADGLNRKLPEGSPLKKYSTEIVLAAQKLEDFTKRTLNLTRSGQLELKPLDINELIENVISEVNFGPITVTTNLQEDIPKIPGDFQLLGMAVKNLLVNSTEAIRGDGQIKVETYWRDCVFVRISDTGTGIPAGRQTTIFRPFFTMKKSGNGLGLAMVKKAVIAHQGKITVESEEGKGSIFTISLHDESVKTNDS